MIIGQYSATCFLAESVRLEPENRHTIVGTFTENLRVPMFPFTVPMGAFITIEPAPPTDTSIRIFATANGEAIFDTDGPSPGAGENAVQPTVNVAIGGIILNFTTETRVELFVSIDHSDPVRIAYLNVALLEENEEP